MHTSAALLALFCVISCVNAHLFLSSVYINGRQDKTCVRAHPASKYDYPLSDKANIRFTSTEDMICGWPPALDTPTQSKCAISVGQKIQLQWWHANENDDVIDSSHHGPCSVYMAKSDTGKGQVWFKIYEEGYNAATKEWCTDRIRKDGPNKGRVDVTIPASLASGNYLLRSEFWALHEGHLPGGAQPYVGCLEVTISGNGNVNPSSLVNIVGLFQTNDPGLAFNIYNQNPTSYIIPGPRVSIANTGSSSGSNTGSSTPTPTTAPSTSGGVATSAPTNPPNLPNTCSATCAVGALACSCSERGFCDRNLACLKTSTYPAGLCFPIECNTGSERCICTQGGACDEGLICLSNTCVRPKNTEAALKEGSASSVSFSLLMSVFAVMVVAFL